jgi:hypothetical protein
MGIFDDIGDFFFGSEDIEAPPPDPLAQKQLELLNEQQQLSNLLLPIILSEDFDVTIDDSGNIVGVVPKDPTELEKDTGEIQNLLAQESLKFLRGEGDVPEQVHSDLAESRTILEESLRKSLGPDFVSSTAGADALAKFDKTATETKEGIRFGRLRDVEALGLARQAGGISQQGADLQQLAAAMGIRQDPLAGITTARGQNQQDAALRAQIDIANRKEGLIGSLFNVAGQAAGRFAGSEHGATQITKLLT